MDVLCTMDGIESFEDELFYSVIESAISILVDIFHNLILRSVLLIIKSLLIYII